MSNFNIKSFFQKAVNGIKRAFTKDGARVNFVRVSKNNTALAFILPIVAILLSFLLASIILLIIGANPFEAITSMFQGAGIIPKARYGGGQSQISDFLKLLNNATPLIFASLGVSVALAAGMFNIGISGTMLLTGFISSVLIGYSPLPAVIARPLVIIISVILGAGAGALVGYLKYKFNINEVVQAIMFNYIYMYLTNYFIYKFFLNEHTRSSDIVNPEARLTIVDVKFGKSNIELLIPLGFILMIFVAIAVRIFLSRTKSGFEIRAVGLNARCAQYAGISVKKNVILAMAISGALGGLAGCTYFLGATNTIKPELLPSTGFDAIAVCLLGGAHPIGIVLASLLISGMTTGGTYMQARTQVSTQVPALIIGIMLTFAACTGFMRFYIKKVSINMEENLKKEGILL